MKITGWTNWRSNDEFKISRFDKVPEDLIETAEKAIIKEIKKKGYSFSGYSHQNTEFGCPILDDKYIYATDQRHWGYLMAVAHGAMGKYDYVKWAWLPEGKEVIPASETIVKEN